MAAKMSPRNSNGSLKRRSNGVGGFHGFSRQDLRYLPPPPPKRARTQTQFGSANIFKVPLYHNNSVPRVSQRCDYNFQSVSDSFGRVSASYVRNNAARNHFPFVSVSSQSMINPNHYHHLPSHNLPGFRAFASETASHQQKHRDNSFDSLPDWDPNEPTTSRIQTGFVSNMPVCNFSNQSLNSHTVSARQNNINNVHGNMIFVPTQVMSNPIQAWVGSDLSDLLNTLKSKGLVSLSDDDREKKTEINKHGDDDSILGIEFDLSFLKVRHESVINALYSDLPRQCSTCGLRFKCQEEHRNHMDWHVRKNRIAKNVNRNKKNNKQVQKIKQSRKWFAGAGLWLTAVTGENVDDKVIAELFSSAEKETKKNEDDEEKEFVVPVDDDQKTCALCKEPFEDFFSDEADEWMYRGAVYLNMHKETRTMTTTTGGKRSILGPIVHVKCMPETPVATAYESKELKLPVAVPSPAALIC